MDRPSSHDSDQFSFYFRHEMMYSLFYQSINTTSRISFSIYGPIVRLIRNFTVFRERNYSHFLYKFQAIDSNKYYILGNSAYLILPGCSGRSCMNFDVLKRHSSEIKRAKYVFQYKKLSLCSCNVVQ